MTHAKLFAALFFLLAFTLTSCKSVDTLVEDGNYERAIRIAQNRLTGKQKKNPKYVAALEDAVNRSIVRDMQAAAYLASSGTPDWGRIHGIYVDIDNRQRALQPLLPLTDKNGRAANFNFVDLGPLLANAENKAADQAYTNGLEALALGRTGDKAAARAAYNDFLIVGDFKDNYLDTDALMAEARELGKVWIYVATVNESGSFLPRGFEEELLRLESNNIDSEWRFYDFTPRPEVQYDYDAQIVIRDIRVSPERITERVYTDERNITDGTEYVLDANGNVAKDTLGNDITRPRQITVRAEVVEVLQEKTAEVRGSLVLYDNDLNRIVQEDAITAEAFFRNYASTYRGDRRALSRDTRRYIGSRARPFPTDEDLILTAADELKPRLQTLLSRSYQTR
ncbi:hypothetical protein [Lewinella sp. 4G2]|uniref:hypothetical protein n=1 Tax=Lewinella sp. 4G2 TaxID=1803372 RepID=UPI0007B4F171|nr:hypothetical protein [Lewinella sp. 4G2]OAV44850.1 hypothetical protein A3850_010260 [Lewinella sp. 4G2]